jgi:hypothetical protein
MRPNSLTEKFYQFEIVLHRQRKQNEMPPRKHNPWQNA